MGLKQILLLCTGIFPGLTTKTSHLIEPDLILPPTVKSMVGHRRLGVIIPLIEQKSNLAQKYLPYGLKPAFSVASPYNDDLDRFKLAANELKDSADIILLDCMGYTDKSRELVSNASGLQVVLSNVLMAKLVSEMI